MNKQIKLAVAGAVLAMGASAAQAGIIIPAGEWTVDISGNVNSYVSTTRTQRNDVTVQGGIAGNDTGGVGSNRQSTNVTTGLLPNFLAISGKTRQNDLDIGFTISIQPGGHSNQALSGGAGQENRQAFMTFGDKSWGTIKAGMDLGIFASDAILSDMTLLGVGGGAPAFGKSGTTTLGGIGTGYLYSDWKGQFSYWSPNWNGFSFAAGVMEPYLLSSSGAASYGNGSTNAVIDQGQQTKKYPAFEAKLAYEWGGDVSGKVWAGGIYQKVQGIVVPNGFGGQRSDNYNAAGWDVGGKVGVSGFELVGYYYDGKGIGTTGFLRDAVNASGNERDSKGGYIQGTYKIPSVGTKLGIAWGVSKLDSASGEVANGVTQAEANALVEKNERVTVGVYHPLTKSLNLVAEYNQVKSDAQRGGDNKSNNISLGAILFF